MNIADIIQQLYPLLLEKYHQVANVELSDFYGSPAIFIEGPGLDISFRINDDYVGEAPERVRFVGELWVEIEGNESEIPFEQNWNRRIYRQDLGKFLQIWTRFFPSDVAGALDLLGDAERILQELILQIFNTRGGI